MDERNWANREDDDLRHSDQAWINDRSWMDRESGNRARGTKYPHYKENDFFESGLPGLMARHPMISSVIVMVLGGLFFLIFSLIYF